MSSRDKFLNRRLPERSYLDFEYEGQDPSWIRLPFYENIKISETRKSNLATHAPIGRNSPLFSWIGAGARNISLQFNFTLPLLVESILSLTDYKSLSNPDKEKGEAYFPETRDENAYYQNISKVASNEYINLIRENDIGPFLRENRHLNAAEVQEITKYRDVRKNDIKSISAQVNSGKLDSVIAGVVDLVPLGIGSLASLIGGSVSSPADIRRDEVIAIVMFWLTVIRTSVLNNAEKPKYGPPLIRLNHGISYRDVGCVCESYSIKFDEKAGMDMSTLLPRVITIDMKLLEVRVGDFSKFIQGDPIAKFNNVGWEILMDNDVVQTIDPGKDEIIGSSQ